MMPKIARKTLGLADGSFSHIGIDCHALAFRGEMKKLCKVSPEPDWLPAPGETSLCAVARKIVREMRSQSASSVNGMSG